MFKPMLAGKAPNDLAKVLYPVLASPKMDGIRCVIRDDVAMSRNLKPIPNTYVQQALVGVPNGVDGELMVAGGFSSVQSAFMSRGEGQQFDFWFFAFDWQAIDNLPFTERLSALTCWSEYYGHNNLRVVEHVLISTPEELLDYERTCLAGGFEGVMLRDPQGEYKFGRSTSAEGWLLKLKRFEDEEAKVVGVVERFHNDNEATTDELGRTKRSAAQAGKRPAGDLGALVCRTEDGAEFQIGTGFNDAQRAHLWAQREQLTSPALPIIVTFKYQPDPGGRKPGATPRFPVFKGFRYDSGAFCP